MFKKNKTKENKVDINNNLEDEHLKELKKAADKSFKTKYTNKKKIATAALCLLGLATIGTVIPIIVSNANAKVDVTVKSSNAAMEKYKVKVKKGTKTSKIKVVELEGYDFVGFFKDEACTKPYKSSDTIKKDATIYASYKLKEAPIVPIEYTVIVNGQAIKVPSFADITIGEAIKEITTLPYETSGVVYLDEACTLEADLNATMTSNTTLYTKAATLDKLSFWWDATTSSWKVRAANKSISGELVIPASYKDNIHDGSITAIEDSAFYGCSNLTSITIPNSVTTIHKGSFQYCGELISITIGNGTTEIGDNAFGFCPNLTSITLESGNIKYHTNGNCIIETASKTLVLGCKTSVIPTDGSVTIIGERSFSGSGLTSIIIPNNITTIGYRAFSSCEGLNNVTIANGVETIGAYAFEHCAALMNLVLGNGVKNIGEFAFNGCGGLNSITVEQGNSVFYSSGNCLIKEGSKKLLRGSNTSVIPGDGSVTTIGYDAFSGCTGLTEIIIPNSVKEIEMGAFSGCSGLTEIKIPNSVTTIGVSAFSGCSGLTSITIPNKVNTIGSSAFSYCSGLTSITVEAGNTKYHSSGNCIIETASKTLVLGCKTSIIPTDGSVTTIGDDAFYYCENLISITIPNSVTTLGRYTFFQCSGLTSITIGNGVTTIGYSVFSFCDALKTVIIDSATIANSILTKYDHSNLFYYATTVYVKTGLDVSGSTYLTSNYTKQATTDKDGYDMWVRKN